MCNILLVTVFLTLICVVCSEDGFLNETIHIRVKRGKYYSYPSRFYRRPPNPYPVKGAFSYTPPPGYMMDDDEPPYPGNPARPKVSRPTNDGLRDDDINNIVKHLSKQDLDKLIDIASEKNSLERRPYKREEPRIIKSQDYSDISQGLYKNQDTEKFNLNGPFISRESDQYPNVKSQDDGYNGPYRFANLEQFKSPSKQRDLNDQQIFNGPRESDQLPQTFRSQDNSYSGPYRSQSVKQYKRPPKPQESTDQTIFNGPYAPNEDLLNYVEDTIQEFNNQPLQPEESVQSKQISYLNTYIHHEINDLPNGPVTISETKEEVLPRPVNLREEDFDISYTNNVPTVVKPSYKVENFGDLPLMSNSYKLDTVSSYKVPHYTVTSSKHSPPPPQPSLPSPSSYSSSSSSASVPLEPAPPKSAAKEQSDAHLKAIKIWTHRSKGTAYTLHSDGTLSLERQKVKYGP